ncbi:MAG TPA: ZIP family metal transporter [Actinomycetes bacterium]|nr:ZIP family metal transporter [Actinomycetes bacterium]
MVLLVALATVGSTTLGGLFALRNHDRMHLILGLSAGVLLGLVAFDLLPELFELSDATFAGLPAVMVAFVVGFLALHVIERWLGMHEPEDSEYGHHHQHAHQRVGTVAAAALISHSFLDGLAIGLAFQVNSTVGWAVALAVLAHDFADGLNTVSIALRYGHNRRRALQLLSLDAIAPLLGAGLTLLVTIPSDLLALYIGAFAGFLLYLATADILPEAHSRHPSRLTLAFTVAGVAAMGAVVSLS